MALFTTSLFRRFRVNYIKTLKLYPMDCLILGGAVATPLYKRRLAQPLYPTIMPLSIRYLIISIYNKTDNHLSVILPKYQALLSSLCSFPMIQPLLVRILNVKPQKYISAKRFNELTYKTINNKCK